MRLTNMAESSPSANVIPSGMIKLTQAKRLLYNRELVRYAYKPQVEEDGDPLRSSKDGEMKYRNTMAGATCWRASERQHPHLHQACSARPKPAGINYLAGSNTLGPGEMRIPSIFGPLVENMLAVGITFPSTNNVFTTQRI